MSVNRFVLRLLAPSNNECHSERRSVQQEESVSNFPKEKEGDFQSLRHEIRVEIPPLRSFYTTEVEEITGTFEERVVGFTQGFSQRRKKRDRRVRSRAIAGMLHFMSPFFKRLFEH